MKNLLNRSVEDIKYKALHALADAYPNSFVVDMLTYFDEKTVFKFLALYGGRQISVPKTETIWKSYRNKVIVSILDVKNDKVVRGQLAEYFGISDGTAINNIYCQVKQKNKYLSNLQVKRVIETIYRKNIEKYHKELKGLFSEKYGIEYFSLHDVIQDPEDLFLLKEAEQNMIKKCRKDVKENRIFVGRGYKIDYALKLIMEKIEQNR